MYRRLILNFGVKMSFISVVGSQKHNAVTFTGQQNLAYINTQTPYDSTSFTSKQNKKKSFLQKHFGEILVGAGVLAAGVFLTKGKLWGKPNLGKVQRNFTEIFGKKNITTEETEKLIQKYREIYNINNKDEFITQAFNQIKKDFGYENTSMRLEISHEKEINEAGLLNLGRSNVKRIRIYSEDSKENIFNTIAHEFGHMRQDEYMFRVNPEKWAQINKDSIFEAVLKNDELKKIHDKSPQEFNDIILKLNNEELKVLETNFGHLPKFKEDSSEYIQVKKYFKAKSSYTEDKKSPINYYFNALERNAKRIGNLMQEVVSYIKFTPTPT